MQALGPFAIPAIGAPDERNLGGGGNLAIGFELTNLSGSLLRIDIGNRSEWLPAFRVNRYPLEGGENTILVSAINQEIANAPESQYLIVVAFTNDAADYIQAFPGNYPSDITRQLAVAGITPILPTIWLPLNQTIAAGAIATIETFAHGAQFPTYALNIFMCNIGFDTPAPANALALELQSGAGPVITFLHLFETATSAPAPLTNEGEGAITRIISPGNVFNTLLVLHNYTGQLMTVRGSMLYTRVNN